MRKRCTVALAAVLLAACTTDDDTAPTTTAAPTTAPATTTAASSAPVPRPTASEPPETDPVETEPVETEPVDTEPVDTEAPDTSADATVLVSTEDPDAVRAGAASRSVLPTVDETHAFLLDAPGWADVDPHDPGVFVPEWDQGRVDVGNGNSDGSWVHDDIRASALAIERGDDLVVMVAADVYMIFAVDAAEIERRAREMLPLDAADRAKIIISATHDHHGPDTAFSVNDHWYDHMADQVAGAIDDAVAALAPASFAVAAGEHRFGVSDGRDPIVIDPALKVMTVTSTEDGSRIATVVQWGSHPETTLGWSPPVDITDACAVKGWTGEDCTAEGRYFTADYPGVLRERLQSAAGGEVLYFNGSIGSQIGPGDADVWLVDDEHPVGDGWAVPDGALPVPAATDLRTQNLARTEAIGAQLTSAVERLIAEAADVDVGHVVWREQPFFTRLTNIGFRVLLADGDLGWRSPDAYLCSTTPVGEDICVTDGGAVVDDPVLTPLTGSRVREGDVLKTRLVHVDLGDVGFLFMPGEIPPELTIGLPATFNADPAPFYLEPELHAVGVAYSLPGYLLELVDEPLTFTVGLGGDELGYWTPIDDVRLRCLDVVLAQGVTCQGLYDMGLLVTPDAIGGPLCRTLADDPAAPDLLALSIDSPEWAALAATCRYGQALGRELGEPAGHYEETNSAGWDLVDDLFAAAEELFGRTATSGGINPHNPGHTPANPPGAG